jgi:imidazolonepropionase-like amidohydrolase
MLPYRYYQTVLKALVFIFLITSFAAYAQTDKVIFCSVFYDAEHAEFKQNQFIVIKADKIVQVSAQYALQPNDVYIDLSGYSVLPGLIDCHTHFLHNEFFDKKTKKLTPDSVLLADPERRIAFGQKNLASYLDAGFTGIRDLGNSGTFMDINFRDAQVAKGNLSPRLYCSGMGLAYRNGQFNGRTASFNQQEYLIVSDSASVERGMAKLLDNRVDVVKVFADNAPNHDFMPITLFTYIVALAHRNHLKVTAHAIYDKSIKLSIEAGVDCIEHGYAVTEETARAMSTHHIAVVPTLEDKNVMQKVVRAAPAKKLLLRIFAPFELKRNKKIITLLYDNNLFVCSGSDAYLSDEICQNRGDFAKSSLFSLLESGILLEKALQSVTYHAAVLMDKKNEVGVLAAGAYADVIAVKGDVRKNRTLLRNVTFVMKGGEVVKR